MARGLALLCCVWLSGCNQLFGIERLQPAAAMPQAGSPAANSGGAGTGSAEPDEDAGTS